jgi:hypothetical protein
MIRGHIVLECDEKSCHAEERIDVDADSFEAITRSRVGMESIIFVSDWRMNDDGELVCPQCLEDAERRDDSHERAAARSRNCDFADNPRHPGRDWT